MTGSVINSLFWLSSYGTWRYCRQIWLVLSRFTGAIFRKMLSLSARSPWPPKKLLRRELRGTISREGRTRNGQSVGKWIIFNCRSLRGLPSSLLSLIDPNEDEEGKENPREVWYYSSINNVTKLNIDFLRVDQHYSIYFSSELIDIR